MIILTGANNDKAKNDQGELYKYFSFKGVIKASMEQAGRCGYKTVVYDLGNLGMGEPYIVEDKTFAKKGFYEKEVMSGYKSKSLFKPAIVKLSMERHDDIVVYLDGDAQLNGCIDEVDTDDYDIGVTLRDSSELESGWHQAHIDIVKFINAGVIFFRPTSVTNAFVDTWKNLTDEIGNDQMALNKLTCPEEYPKAWSVQTIDGVRIKYFPCKQYNFYYFEDGLVPDIKIMHFKGPVRHFYPFNWKKRLYCRTVVPVVNYLKVLLKGGTV